MSQADLRAPDFDSGDWAAVEQFLGSSLPGDYKSLVGDGNALVFDGELFIASPFDRRPTTSLVPLVASASWAAAVLRSSFPEDFDMPIFPEPGGILCWGVDGGGGEYFWDTRPDDPNQWTVVITGRPILEPGGQRHPCALREYFAGLSDGSIAAAALGGWPGPNPSFERYD